MSEALARDYCVESVWLEEDSRTTWENAAFSRAMMQERGVNKIYLVTHAWHMPRPCSSFEQVGFEVNSAPTSYAGSLLTSSGLLAWLPRAQALRATRWALHERVGDVWYRLRHYD
jgi:uncharacterized SAM-binding protein YcdF (DUF218 family)